MSKKEARTLENLTEIQLLRIKEKLLIEAQWKEDQKILPHISKLKHYRWSRAYFESTAKMAMITAANQIGKSTVNIRTCIDWAINKRKWSDLWPGMTPNLFWYFYPTSGTAVVEWKTKWLPLMPPEDHPEYGYTVEWVRKDKDIRAIHFFSGVSVYFQTYAKSVFNLQSATVYAVFCDEELPDEYFDELQFRLSATDGYFRLVFTATLGQELWRRAMEPQKGETPTFPDAFKQTVSMYDCLYFEDESPGRWTVERIKERERGCRSQKEVQRRIMGRFVKDDGLKYPRFSQTLHIIEPKEIPEGWNYYAGLDYGSGGPTGHPSAIVILAVSPDYDKAYCIRQWRGDDEVTTAGDLYQKFMDICFEEQIQVLEAFYDFACKDLETIANRNSEVSLVKAEKSHTIGEQTLNVLLASNMLHIFDRGDGEAMKLATELNSLAVNPTLHARNDLSDALRYSVAKIPWDLSNAVQLEEDKVTAPVAEPLKKAQKTPEKTIDPRMEEAIWFKTRNLRKNEDTLEQEMEDFNELCG